MTFPILVNALRFCVGLMLSVYFLDTNRCVTDLRNLTPRGQGTVQTRVQLVNHLNILTGQPLEQSPPPSCNNKI